jgi:hypothetical protein
MTMIGQLLPDRVVTLRLSSANRANSPARSPAFTPCFDIFSPLPGERDVISQVERLSSNDAKIAASCVRIAVVSSIRSSSDIGGLQVEWV